MRPEDLDEVLGILTGFTRPVTVPTLVAYDRERLAAELVAFGERASLDAAAMAGHLEAEYVSRYGYGTAGYAELATLPVETLRRELTAAMLAHAGIEEPAIAARLALAAAAAEQWSTALSGGAFETLAALRGAL